MPRKKLEHHESISLEAARKLEDLAKFMEDVPSDKFFMWGYAKRGGMSDVLVCPFDLEAESCGTACCLAGWQVIRDGYCLRDNDVYKSVEDYSSNLIAGTTQGMARESLGLSYNQAESLFYSWNWPMGEEKIGLFDPTDPKSAAERIRHLIKTGE